MTIKAIILDCFGVLIMPGRIMLQQDYPQVARDIDDFCRQSDYGMITRDEFNQSVSGLVGLTPQEVQLKYYNTNMHNKQLIDWAYGLKQTGKYKVGVISNVGHNWLNKFLAEAGQPDLFDEVILSSDVSVLKPDPTIFQIMADRIGVPVQECVMIDDLLANVDGAEHAGMQGIVFGSNQQLQDDFNRLIGSDNA